MFLLGLAIYPEPDWLFVKVAIAPTVPTPKSPAPINKSLVRFFIKLPKSFIIRLPLLSGLLWVFKIPK
ncbi:hypothetical protein [Moraxella lacunata]|uniref:hypothetical protein n=1 Tax=Moraxella lacunata TaxID=477 RepID=UPI003EDE8950